MDGRRNGVLVALGSAAAVLVLLAAFVVVWLIPRGPETSDASPAGSTVPQSGQQANVNKALPVAQPGLAQTGAPNMAAISDQAHISVHGTGVVSAKPDMAVVQVGVQIQNPSLQAAQGDAANKMDAIMKQLKSAGIDDKDISTSQYSVEPVMNYKDNTPPEVTGYRVTNIVSVKLHDLSTAGKTIDSLVDAGANSLYGVTFSFSDPSALMKQAREVAMADAKDKAVQLAALGGVGLGGPLSITDGGSNTPQPVVAPMAAAGAGSRAADTSISPGQQEVRVEVDVLYAMK